MQEYNSFYTWITETQTDNETPIGPFDLTIGKFAQRIKKDVYFPHNSHRKQYHINYMLKAWSDVGLEGVGFEGAVDVVWPMYVRAIGGLSTDPLHVAWSQHLAEKGVSPVYGKTYDQMPIAYQREASREEWNRRVRDNLRVE